MRTKTIVILAVTAVLAVLLMAATPAPAPRPARAPTPPAAPAPPSPHPDDQVFFFSAGGTWLGVQIADIDGDRVRELGLKEEMGAEIQEVLPESPAAAAGLKEGDVIVEYQGTPVQGVAQLTRLVRETPAGRTVRIRVYRDGSSRDVSVKVSERESEQGLRKRITRRFQAPRVVIPKFDIPDIEIPDIPEIEGFGPMRSTLRLGVMVDSLNGQLGQFFGVKDGEGVLVRSVKKGSPAEAAGLRAGDVIVKVDGERISDASDLRQSLREVRDREAGREEGRDREADRGERRDREVVLTIVRDRKEQTVKVAVPRGGERRHPRVRPVEEGETPEVEEEDVPDHEMEQVREEVERIKRDVRNKKQEIRKEMMRIHEGSWRPAPGARVI